MKTVLTIRRLKGFRFPREVISYAVWAYHRFALSTADVEDLLAERGVMVSRETVRNWVNRFGRHFADCIKRDRPGASDKWHLDEVVVPIHGVKFWLWRAVDANGNVLDILVQRQRNAKAARRFLKRLIDRFGAPRVVITDKLRSYVRPVRNLAANADHRAHITDAHHMNLPHQYSGLEGACVSYFWSWPRLMSSFGTDSGTF